MCALDLLGWRSFWRRPRRNGDTRQRILTAMAIPHALPGQAIDVAPLGTRLSSAQTIALFKSADLEVIRLVLPVGKSLPPHKVAGEITIQSVEGAIDVTAGDQSHVLPDNCSTCPATSCTASPRSKMPRPW